MRDTSASTPGHHQWTPEYDEEKREGETGEQRGREEREAAAAGDDFLGRRPPSSASDSRLLLLPGGKNRIKIFLSFRLLLLLPALPSTTLPPTPRHDFSGEMKLQLICRLPSQGLNYFTKSSLAPNSHLLRRVWPTGRAGDWMACLDTTSVALMATPEI